MKKIFFPKQEGKPYSPYARTLLPFATQHQRKYVKKAISPPPAEPALPQLLFPNQTTSTTNNNNTSLYPNHIHHNHLLAHLTSPSNPIKPEQTLAMKELADFLAIFSGLSILSPPSSATSSAPNLLNAPTTLTTLTAPTIPPATSHGIVTTTARTGQENTRLSRKG